MMRRLLVCLALALFAAGPVAACINDSELPSHEREFRSQYRSTSPYVPPVQTPSGKVPLMFLGGGVLLTGALTATVIRRRK
jgi:hypothetical protein